MNHPLIPSNSQNPSISPIDSPPIRIVNPKLSLKELLFSFHGRIPRKAYWMVEFGRLFALLFLYVLVIHFAAVNDETSAIPMWFLLFKIVFFTVITWTSLAVAAKRWHDRGKSGWMFMVSFIPLIGGIWMILELGCLRGTVGSNKYGEDPTGLY